MGKTKEEAPQDGAVKQETSAETPTKKSTVVKSFRDKDNFETVHAVGQEITASEERIDFLVELGLVEVEKPADAKVDDDDADKNKDPK